MNACNPTCTEPIFDALVRTNQFSNVFSMCLNEETGGVLDLGEIDNKKFVGELQYTPITNHR